jgi:two-component system alkaline phosphatase synthesis response regulator PhoP
MKATLPPKILIIEDEAHIAEGLKLNLTLQAYTVRIAPDGVSGLQEWKTWQPDLIVLDIMLPGIDGLEVLQNIRLDDEQLPILILSARAAPDDRIKGLSFGVDDYLAKPFNLEEFLLRVERLLQRAAWNRPPGKDPDHSAIPPIYRFGNNAIDFQTATAQCQAGDISLTELEIKLLKVFIANPGKPLSRKKLLALGWGYAQGTSTRTVDNFMVRFRKYFESNPRKPAFFKSKRSIGYVFTPEGE